MKQTQLRSSRFLTAAAVFLLGVVWLAVSPTTARAENMQDFGDYVVHVNALNTNLLPPSVAADYKFRRSPYQALLNIAVLRKVMGTTGQPVPARVTGSARNLTGVITELNLREIREGTAIYYIDTFRISNEETLEFQIQVRPEGTDDTFNVVFRKQFYTE